MSNQVPVKTIRTLSERYELLRKTLAHYLLLQVGTFVKAIGFDSVGPAMEILTAKKADLKVRDIIGKGRGSGMDAVEALSQNLAESMGETFDSDYDVKAGDSSRTVTLARCGCIESVMAQAGDHGLTAPQARAIFCGTCLGSYRKAAESLDLRFKGRLSKEGCMMGFFTK